MLNPGDEVISTNDLYGGSYRLFNTIFGKYGIKFHYVSMANPSDVEALVIGWGNTANDGIIYLHQPLGLALDRRERREEQSLGDVVDRDSPEVEALAAGLDSLRDLVWMGGAHDEDDV